jgi:hypothetical protein
MHRPLIPTLHSETKCTSLRYGHQSEGSVFEIHGQPVRRSTVTHFDPTFSDELLEDLVSDLSDFEDGMEYSMSNELDLDLSDSSLDKVLWEDDDYAFVAED